MKSGIGTINDVHEEIYTQTSSRLHLVSTSSSPTVSPTTFPAVTVKTSGFVYNVAGNGNAGNSDNLPANISTVVGPTGVCVDAHSNIYITQYGGHRVRIIVRSTGFIYTIAGTGVSGYNGDNIAGTAAQLNQPLHSTTDSKLNLYIADYSNNRIRRVDATSRLITTVAGTGIGGYVDNVAATSAQISRPAQLAFDSSGNLFFADAFNYRVRMISSATGILSTIVYISNGFVMHIALDSTGNNVYIGDAGNMEVVKYTISTGVLTVLAGTGIKTFTSDGAPATSSGLNWPRGMVIDPFGTMYFADAGNCRIRKIDSNGILTTVVGTGNCNFNGNGLTGTSTNTAAEGLAFDANFTLFFAEESGNRVRAMPYVCPLQTFSSTGKYPCILCPVGSSTNSTSARSIVACNSCALGYFSTTGRLPCAVCPAGTYNPTVGSKACLPCSQGTYSPNNGSSSYVNCQYCPAGSYNPVAGSISQSACLSCPPGTYRPYTGGNSASSCTNCGDGYYSPNSGSSSCQTCPTGYTGGVGAASCTTLNTDYTILVGFVGFVGGLTLLAFLGIFREDVMKSLKEVEKAASATLNRRRLAAAEAVRVQKEREDAIKQAAEDAAAEAIRKERVKRENEERLERERQQAQRDRDRAALTPELFDEFDVLNKTYPTALSYQKMTVNAKAALLVGDLDLAWSISTQRRTLQYTPENEGGVTDMLDRLLELKRRLREREAELSSEVTLSVSIDYAEICNAHLIRIQKLVGNRVDAGDLKIISWSELSPYPGPCLLGTGQFGTAYKLLWSSQPVAVKIVNSAECEFKNRNYDVEMLRSVEEAERVVDICNRGGIGIDELVVKVYGFVKGPITSALSTSLDLPVGDDAFGIVMRLEAGGTLRGRLYPPTPGIPVMPLNILEKLRFIQQITRGLFELHKMGVIHADLKPANILMSDKNPSDCRLADFGQSFVREDAPTRLGVSTLQLTSVARGTPVYSAPEMLRLFDDNDDENDEEGLAFAVSGKVSRSTDVYALGIMMHEILSMQEPFKGLSEVMLRRNVCDGDRPPRAQLPADTPPAVRALMEKCWDGDRNNRPSAAECNSTMTHTLSVAERAHFDIFFSYSHSKHPFIVHMFDVFTKLGYKVWLDMYNMEYDMLSSMQKGIEQSTITMSFVDQSYQQSKNCQGELQHARDVAKKPVVVVIAEGNFWSWSTDTFKELCDVKTKMFADLSEVACQAWNDPDKEDGLTAALVASTALQDVQKILKDLDCRPSAALVPSISVPAASSSQPSSSSFPNNVPATNAIAGGIAASHSLLPSLFGGRGRSKRSKVYMDNGNESTVEGVQASKALPSKLSCEYLELSKYPLIQQYEPLTERAKEAFSAGQMDELKRIGAARAALQYSPTPGFTIATGRSRLMQLQIDLQGQRKSLLKDLTNPQAIEECVACTVYVDKVQELLNVAVAPPPKLMSQGDGSAVDLKVPGAALTEVFHTEFQFLKDNCSNIIKSETLTQKQKLALNNRKPDEAKAFFEQRAALNYTPPSGFTVSSARARLSALQSAIQHRRRELGANLQVSENISYVVACSSCLRTIETLLKECSDALPVVNAMINRSVDHQLRTIAWTDFTADTPNCVLGTGSFGRVFQLSWQQPGGNLPVAVKVMSETFAKYAKRDYAAALAMAKQEAETIHEISVRGGDAMSTYVIQVYGFVQGPLPATLTNAFKGARVGEEAYGIVMRLEAGGSLGQLLHPAPGKPKIPLSTEEKIRILTFAARGLAELHRIGTVHADLKPDNFLLSGQNPPDVRIADFGLSVIREQMAGPDTATTASVQRTGTIAGTKLYNAPELLPINADVDGKVARASRSTDIYAFGIVMYEVLSGKVPYEGQTEINDRNFETKISHGVRPLTTGLLPLDTPPSLIELMEKCWDGDRANRPTAAECLATITHDMSVLESKEFDVFYSHRWGDGKNKKFLTFVCFELRRMGYLVWFDVNHMGFDLVASMKGGIARSKVVVACVDSGYQERPNCMLELHHARELSPPKTVVTVITQPDIMAWGSPELKKLCGVPTKPVLDISGSAAMDGWDSLDGPTDAMKARVDEEVKELVKMLKAVGCEPSL